MTTYTETLHAGGFITGELPDCLSRKSGILAGGQNLVAGAVVGKITKAQAAAPIPTIVGTGTGAMTALTFGPDIQTGSYVITLLETSATAAFSVTKQAIQLGYLPRLRLLRQAAAQARVHVSDRMQP